MCIWQLFATDNFLLLLTIAGFSYLRYGLYSLKCKSIDNQLHNDYAMGYFWIVHIRKRYDGYSIDYTCINHIHRRKTQLISMTITKQNYYGMFWNNTLYSQGRLAFWYYYRVYQLKWEFMLSRFLKMHSHFNWYTL